ncbi:MAG: hypothetical protein NTU98_15075 [Bacteroidetes bacterium]|nr:hypothetical protein [Bacteroidota bacterium]
MAKRRRDHRRSRGSLLRRLFPPLIESGPWRPQPQYQRESLWKRLFPPLIESGPPRPRKRSRRRAYTPNDLFDNNTQEFTDPGSPGIYEDQAGKMEPFDEDNLDEKYDLNLRESWIVKSMARFLPRMVISMAIFMVTYLLVWFIYQMAVIVVGSVNNIPSVMTYYEVRWTIPNDSPLWTDLNIIAVTGSGPLISLLLGIFCLIFLKSSPKLEQMTKLFLTWLCLSAMSHFFGAFVAGALTWQGFGYVIAWMYLPFAVRLVISVLFLAIMVYISWLLIPVMHSLAPAQLGKKELRSFLATRFVIPWFFGTGILMLIKIPNTLPQHENIFIYDIIILCSLAFAILPMLSVLFIRSAKRPRHFTEKSDDEERNLMLSVWLTITVMVLLIYRFGLNYIMNNLSR